MLTVNHFSITVVVMLSGKNYLAFLTAKHYTLYMSRPTHTTAACPTCHADFDRLPMDYDEDTGIGYAILEVHPCAHETCGKLLCGACDQFHCDGCSGTFCADHLISIEDGTDRPLHCCPPCAEEGELLLKPMPPGMQGWPVEVPATEVA
jgi:hypothetical protein